MGIAEECGREVLETIPLVMRAIREEMRKRRTADLSVPQFRALAYLRSYPKASLSDAAEHVGTTLPSMSKLMTGLVTKGYVRRRESPEDRRCVVLTLTQDGKSVLAAARKEAQERLAEMLTGLSEKDGLTITQAMRTLRLLFAAGTADAPERSEDGAHERDRTDPPGSGGVLC